MIVDFNEISPKKRYKIVSNTVIPRPIAWILTQNKTLNAAPFSYFIPLSSEPPTLIVSIGHKKDGSPKDTLKNLRDTKKCTICMVDENLLENMHYTSKALDEDISEIDEFNIKTQKILKDFPPIVKNTPAAFFCSLFDEIKLGGKTIPLILKIEKYYIDEKFIKDDFEIELDLIARVGAKYAKLCNKIDPPKI